MERESVLKRERAAGCLSDPDGEMDDDPVYVCAYADPVTVE